MLRAPFALLNVALLHELLLLLLPLSVVGERRAAVAEVVLDVGT
jgi:hypothetical protein